MDKYKLFNFESSLSLELLKEQFIANKNISDISFEIKPIRLTDTNLGFNFSENKLMETYLLDINGNEQLIEYLQIDSFDFQVISTKLDTFLLIKNPPRSLKNFKQSISEILNYEVSFIEININPLEWIESLEKSSEYTFEIRSLEVKEIIFSSSTNGSMTLKSQSDLRNSYKSNIKSNNYKICKALVLNDNFFKGRFILSADASFQLDCMNANALIDLLINNL